MTTETVGPPPASADGLEVEELVHDLSLLEVDLLGVHRPHIVVRALNEIEAGEDRSPHRVILVVVAVETVAPAGGEVLEGAEVVLERLDGFLVVAVVHR